MKFKDFIRDNSKILIIVFSILFSISILLLLIWLLKDSKKNKLIENFPLKVDMLSKYDYVNSWLNNMYFNCKNALIE